MILDIVYLVAGLVVILIGANALTDSASALARRFGISDLVVGLTVVAFGTSTPELVISGVSAMGGNSGIAIGNVIGSNIFNILAIIGITAMVRPMVIQRTIMTREIPMVVISSLVILIMGCTPMLNGESEAILSRTDGFLLLIFFGIFMWYTMATAKSAAPDDPAEANAAEKGQMKLWKSILWILGGLTMLIVGGNRFVAGATGIAQMLNLSDAIIGLTIAAAGSSLPELATSVVAARKGNSAIAIGNVIGSNIFNAFFVLGASATISPLKFGSIGIVDLATLMIASILFLACGWWIGNRTITRSEGVLFTLCYIAYVTYLILNV